MRTRNLISPVVGVKNGLTQSLALLGKGSVDGMGMNGVSILIIFRQTQVVRAFHSGFEPSCVFSCFFP